jgi:hypothetical protein
MSNTPHENLDNLHNDPSNNNSTVSESDTIDEALLYSIIYEYADEGEHTEIPHAEPDDESVGNDSVGNDSASNESVGNDSASDESAGNDSASDESAGNNSASDESDAEPEADPEADPAPEAEGFQSIHNTLLNQLIGLPLFGVGGSGFMTMLGANSVNYFANANDEFKILIGDNKTAQKLYNCCCNILLGQYTDFVGRFTDDYLCKSYSIINEFYHAIIGKLNDNEASFFDDIFVLVLDSLYQSYKDKKAHVAKHKLEKYIHEFNGDKFENECCICMCDIDAKYAKLPCGHAMHYECVHKWFMEQLVCPVCRHSLENDSTE